MARVSFSDAAAAAATIPDGATIAVTGSGGGLLEPDALFAAIEARFLASGHPRDLTLVHALGMGDRDRRGTNRFAHDGLVRKVIAGHWSWSPRLQAMVKDNKIEAYCLPTGVISHLLREIGAGRPGLITPIGLGTFVDPRQEGGRCNARSTESPVELVEIDGRAMLRYKPFRVDIGLVRASYADVDGNLAAVHEAADLDAYAVALAAHNCGGRVIAQVKHRLEHRAMPARLVLVPGILVDQVVTVPDQAQSYRGDFDPGMSGEIRVDLPPGAATTATPDPVKLVIARRAADQLNADQSVNFGYGVPGLIPAIAAARGIGGYWTSVEQGIHNGTLLDGSMFGAALNPMAIVSSLDQFDFYSGGGVDVAFLGMGEMDRAGNVNVSKLDGQLVGPGGFIDISTNARALVFCGTFDAKGAHIELVEGGLRIRASGAIRKVVNQVAQITFSGAEARRRGQNVLYVTERAVFRLAEDGIELIEVAPGIDVERDVLGGMGFRPVLRNPAPMPAEHFRATAG